MNSQGQFSDSGNNQHPFISASYNLQDTPVSSHEKQESSTTPCENVSQSPYFQSQPTVNNLCVQPDSSANLKTQPVHPTIFFFRPPNDYYHYHVICKEISNDIVAYLLNKSLKERSVQPNENECIFYYQQQCNNRLYQVSCEIVSPLLVNNCLSKNFLGVEFQQNMEQEHIVLTFDQKEYLECHLKKYLSQYLLG
ncbi:unnamed protein product [Rhizophagus irregularis]|uniref:Uncharacterized protein n=1 Tax=Rhizophagus irregularis TaxID=588596 RepID=A0A2N1MUK5_9GLOM|nr:hypothetical protein RhiirC2_868868 [Rhizophagus irregularis]CAB4393624.1 unnamed protein product [Rhizophagus irregularis]CAB5362529.1 unnamed protein product [Rhizophagus irregularis]